MPREDNKDMKDGLEEIVEMIKRGDNIKSVKKYFSSKNGRLAKIHLMNGYSDPDYQTRFN